MMRFVAILSFCLILTGCVSNTPLAGKAPTASPGNAAAPAPSSASTVYTVSDLNTGQGPCGSISDSQVIGYPATASGASTPTLTIASPNRVDRWGIPAIDGAGNIYVNSVNITQDCQEVMGSEKILVFAPVASGTFTAVPIRTIAGPATQLFGVARMTADTAGNLYLWESQGAYAPTAPGTIIEFAAGVSGNVAPIRTIDVPQYPSFNPNGSGGGYPAGLAVDGSGNIVFAVSGPATNVGPSSFESDQIEIFTPDQSGNATPARTISGAPSQLTAIYGLAVDGAGNIYVEMADAATAANPTILEFAGGANGTASTTPMNRISVTQPSSSRFLLDSIAADAQGNVYVLTYIWPYSGSGLDPYYLLRFDAGSTGNAAPAAALLSVSGLGVAAH